MVTYPPPPSGPYGPPPGSGAYEPPPYGHGQGQPFGYGPPPTQPPDNYLVWSILCTVLCCLPLGIVAIINSSKVNGLWAAGQYGEAQKASENAKKFAMWGAIAGVVAGVIYFIIAMSTGMSNI